MRLVLFVLSITFSACLFVWKTNMLADMNASWQSMAASQEASRPDGFAGQMMAMAMAAMGGGGTEVMGSMVVGDAASMPGLPDTQATYDEISKQLGGFGGSSGGGSSVSRPKEFSARFVKARESN
jgi:hypothetical protein